MESVYICRQNSFKNTFKTNYIYSFLFFIFFTNNMNELLVATFEFSSPYALLVRESAYCTDSVNIAPPVV